MICHRNRCIFIHQRKCAGNAIRAMLFAQATPAESLFLIDGAMSPSAQLAEYYKDYRHYTVFTVVRNPWDRFISGWLYLKKYITSLPLSDRQRHSFNPAWSLTETIEKLPQLTGHDFRHLACQQHRLVCWQGRWLPDVVLRFETLQADFAALCHRLGVPVMVLPQINSTPHNHYSTYYNGKQRMAVARYFQQDIEEFNYRFEAQR